VSTGMAPTCRACLRSLAAATTCDPTQRKGTALFGDEMPGEDWIVPDHCHDCAVIRGGAHHPGLAWCDNCEQQRLVCGCDEEWLS
jgi:hypothetical protein